MISLVGILVYISTINVEFRSPPYLLSFNTFYFLSDMTGVMALTSIFSQLHKDVEHFFQVCIDHLYCFSKLRAISVFCLNSKL